MNEKIFLSNCSAIDRIMSSVITKTLFNSVCEESISFHTLTLEAHHRSIKFICVLCHSRFYALSLFLHMLVTEA